MEVGGKCHNGTADRKARVSTSRLELRLHSRPHLLVHGLLFCDCVEGGGLEARLERVQEVRDVVDAWLPLGESSAGDPLFRLGVDESLRVSLCWEE